MAVLPKSMQSVDGDVKLSEKVNIIYDYIQYLSEQLEYNFSLMNKKISELESRMESN